MFAFDLKTWPAEWASAEKIFDKDELIKTLSSGLSKITFFKVDGSVREMVCTRDVSIIPSDRQESTGTKTFTSTIPVYDVENDGWRSFIVDNLISIERDM